MKNPFSLSLFTVILLFAGCGNPSQAPTQDVDEHAGHDHGFRLVSFEYDPEAYEAVPLNYQLTGRGDTVLFFVHGWNIDQTYWAPQVAFFSGRYRVLTIDLPGHGQSGREREHWTTESYAKDLRSVIEKEDLQNIVLIGHSMSGDITLQTALLIPDRIIALVGVDNFKDIDFKMDDETRFQLSDFLNEMEEDFARVAGEFAFRYLLDRTKDAAAASRVTADYQRADPKIAVSVLKYTFPSAARIKDRLAQLTMPLYLISCTPGEVNEEALKVVCKKGVDIRYVEGSGHFPMIEQPQVFNELLLDIVQKVK